MFNINIDQNTYHSLIWIIVLLLFVSLLIFIAFIYHTKRKFESIREYCILLSDKLSTYEDMQKQYNKIVEESGIKSKKKDKLIKKMLKKANQIRGSG